MDAFFYIVPSRSWPWSFRPRMSWCARWLRMRSAWSSGLTAEGALPAGVHDDERRQRRLLVQHRRCTMSTSSGPVTAGPSASRRRAVRGRSSRATSSPSTTPTARRPRPRPARRGRGGNGCAACARARHRPAHGRRPLCAVVMVALTRDVPRPPHLTVRQLPCAAMELQEAYGRGARAPAGGGTTGPGCGSRARVLTHHEVAAGAAARAALLADLLPPAPSRTSVCCSTTPPSTRCG